ncbi:lysozyme inhibitor LprI family protein [Acuticoccus sp. I52.16.1]|uniref:lysozyme inhibitor LprI family protein n=1 Tax=Acuticoccus sp. I52.16.1 TaxID=2928472 RepID=UPI001FD0DFCE|nr:lysozyme inhibitor LprI family protein [Acuticoccus sp. I52.16.1]UOM34102.1 lysozyme inhibitor LprI family protein [Acuticoccus sp. I52.16.1]
MTRADRWGWCGAAAALLLAAGIGGAAAQPCGDDATQAELNACAGRAVDAAEADLAQMSEEILARLPDEEARAGFQAAQEAWTAYRDAECTFAASGVAGGSIYPLVWGECIASLTDERAATLDGFLHCEEGDTSCPVPPAQ